MSVQPLTLPLRGSLPLPASDRKRGEGIYRAAPSPRLRGEGRAEGCLRSIWSAVLWVVGRFAGDRDVVDVALAKPPPGNPKKGAVLLHLTDRAIAVIAHP